MRRIRIVSDSPLLLLFLCGFERAYSQDASLAALRSEDALAGASYRDAQIDVDARARDLLQRMTLDEKIGQMILVDWRYLAAEQDIATFHLGALLGGGGARPQSNTPHAWAKQLNAFQAVANNSVLKIPLLFGNDAVHGFGNLQDATIFPHHIGLGASGNAALVEQIGAATAREIAAVGVNWNYSPAVSIPRDIRWGRTYEGFSSDNEIVSVLGAAEIRGLQQERTVLATAKHFVADGGTSLGKDRGDAKIDTDELFVVHMQPYKTAIAAGVQVIMASHSSINGAKMHGNRSLMQAYLKDELGFDGFIVSDWAAIYDLAPPLDNQLQAAVNAGVDMIMVPESYQDLAFAFQRLVGAGKITIDRIDDAVLRILRVKFAIGLFEAYRADTKLINTIRSQDHLRLARQAVSETMVLLKNEQQALPLQKSDKIVVVGNYANNIGIQSGGWTIEWQGRKGKITAGTTLLAALRQQGGAAQVDYAPTQYKLEALRDNRYDAVLVVIGEEPYAEGLGDDVFPKISNKHEALVLQAQEYFDAPIITLMISGRPFIINSIVDASDALVALWLPGTEGLGISDVLFGDKNFSGTLSFQWPRDRRSFKHGQGDPLYPLGHGLRYRQSSVRIEPRLKFAICIPLVGSGDCPDNK